MEGVTVTELSSLRERGDDNQIEPDDAFIDLIESESWLGKAGGYDLAGKMGAFATLVEGSESTVLGFTQESLEHLDELQSLFSMSRS